MLAFDKNNMRLESNAIFSEDSWKISKEVKYKRREVILTEISLHLEMDKPQASPRTSRHDSTTGFSCTMKDSQLVPHY